MEFREYGNPEEQDYDIKSSLDTSLSTNEPSNHYYEQLFDLIGLLEDIDENELMENYGISLQEYYNPNVETIKKVSEKIESKQNGISR